jgi:hypothetical protein
MKPKPQEKNKKATCRATQGRWQEMNRKQRREMMRKIRSDDLGLEDEAECPRRHAAVFSRLSRGLQGLHGVRNDHCWVGRHAVELSTSKTTCLPKTSATVCGTLSRLRLRGAFRARRFALRRSQSTEWFTIPNSMHATGAIGQHLQSRTRS